ncbi:hypothetical protein BD410DRAFT_712399 [Rickenella mellea]|uniref:RINT-1 family protein n=1 Tax=Rickenella mellea TaxID=50990 RepID=A0A4Y7QMJ3_9AGAM|nr:hypothetical protein BD410DRAFT_712399 [Rickenella mellea]
MSAIQIQTLLRPPNHDRSVSQAVSLLNSNFTTIEQLTQNDALSALVNSTHTTNSDLASKLSTSNTSINELISITRTRAREQLTAAQELSLLRHSLADELTGLSEELVSTGRDNEECPTLLEEIETLHRSLKELESVQGYIAVIERALVLSESAVEQVKQANAATVLEESVTEYKALQAFVTSVKAACDHADDGAGHSLKLVSFLEGVREKAWLDVKNSFSQTLLSSVEKLHWPMPVDYASALPDDRKRFESAFINLLKLQSIGEKLHGDAAELSPKDGLYPLQALVHPVSLRFKYHFEGTRQTNKLDKPEWYFVHILNVSHEHRDFMDAVVQPLVRAYSPPTARSPINAWREFTRLLLPILARKLRKTVPLLLPYPPLLAHTIYQALSFDTSLKEAGFGLGATYVTSTKDDKQKGKQTEDEWPGTSDIILGKKEWFDAWLDGEKNFAEDQYNEIISAPDAWQITERTDDEDTTEELRPTTSARRFKAIIEQITERYRPLPSFGQKTRFLIAIQVPLLELYHTRISESLDAFETLSSFLVRAVPGALAGQQGHGGGMDGRRMTSGVEGAKRLVKAFISAKYITAAMANWGEDLFFLELWQTICERSTLRARVENNPLLPDPSAANVEDEGTLFDELIAQYGALASRAEGMLVRQVCGEVEAELKAHFYRRPEGQRGSETQEESVYISPTLAAPVSHLSGHIAFLRSALPPSIASSLYRRIASDMAAHILQRGVLARGRGSLSLRDGRSVRDESELWVESSRMALGPVLGRRAEASWARLLDAGRLVSLEKAALVKVARVAFRGGEKEYEGVMEEVGVGELTRQEVKDVLTLREEVREGSDYP